ncbi:hypothetical protein GGR51DRAFT_523062 [Nemania sp. FL0031]|nr:hypothetical protein GGR51DRAFT_523062 [Nemania sp. FL0031]
MAYLLAPYNDSMRLGQGFNSYFHQLCIDGAVDIPEDSIQTQPVCANSASNVGQNISYSSRSIEKVSDLVRSMNISAASSIKYGTISVFGNSLGLDEGRFATNDLNAVISVKVINQTVRSLGNAEFVALKGIEMDSGKFFEIYGDCYISGFIEGGDLHGIISAEYLEIPKKAEVESILKRGINSFTNAGASILDEESSLSCALSQTKTNVTATWSGGGQIKPDSEEWTLDTLLRAAAAFPSRVAKCPQRTYAILTPYENNPSFVRWAEENGIVVPAFSRAQKITSDLLDVFMAHKHNLSRIQAITANPTAYRKSDSIESIDVDVVELIAERRLLKQEMNKINRIIDDLNKDPAKEPLAKMQSPILWAQRLPIAKSPVTARRGPI